jgi:hypothetical protein
MPVLEGLQVNAGGMALFAMAHDGSLVHAAPGRTVVVGVDRTGRAALTRYRPNVVTLHLGTNDLNEAARQFFTREFAKPATVDELADACSSPEEAAKIYTAARLAVDVDTDQEHEFLAALAERLGIDDGLAAHIDAAARNAR